MKKITLFLIFTTACAVTQAGELQNIVNAAEQAASPQTKQTIERLKQEVLLQTPDNLPLGDLTNLLMRGTGVNQMQAQGGLGALLKIAKGRMKSGEFAQLEQAIPDLPQLLNAVPILQKPSTLSSLARLAGNSGSIGDMITAVSVFKELGMSPSMIQRFVPMLLGYVQTAQGEQLARTLSSALIGK
jgi:hypothetical protein